ncbi:Signal transduction histidine kinase [Allokutzneria albata]|uniref:Signal transduction histidine-protein kinase/phosphatase MprB n=1 Tax=Allokutzneria albata TaxID=211114 RepID=A0A1G9VSU3_ALLAB|nr:ATP-binding protein [Allokutzneria albata]SDM75278.1 Signal transduction histidine kinase [Allokutzneria albata]
MIRAWLDRVPRPLDPVPSIKFKLGVVVVVSITASLLFFWYQIGWLPPRTAITAVLVALVASQVLAHGMTRPLREMTSAAKSMARGDYDRRVRATARDEVGQLATAFNRMAADLGAADQQRRDLIANVSHELRTPISALRAVLENVVDGVTPPDSATMRTALAQTERLGALVSELLDLSRIDAGAHRLDRSVFPVRPLLESVVAEAQVMAPSARFVTDVSDEATVYADRGRLHQVVVNLLDNAARHGPPGGEVRLLAAVRGADLVIEVHDEGPGIPPEERDRVFERFTRGERAGGGGTGLGLAIARWVVDLHGGTIAALGSHIRVTLPATHP